MSVNAIHHACPKCFAAPGYQCVGRRGPRRSCHRSRWDKAYQVDLDRVGIRREKIGMALAKAVFERDRYRCKRCDTHLDLTCDHIEPVSLGGETSLANLQTLCRPCNSAKGNRF